MEQIIHCTPDGTIIGPISKVKAHLPGIRETQTHYSTWSMIFNPVTGKYGIQRKNPALKDKLSAGKWDMGVAGHNCYVGEGSSFRPLGFDENLQKEAQEEIGLSLRMAPSLASFIAVATKPVTQATGFIFEQFLYKTATNNEWVGLGFVLVPNDAVKFVDGEVVEFAWFTPKELQTFLDTRDDYAEPLRISFEKSERFRKAYLV